MTRWYSHMVTALLAVMWVHVSLAAETNDLGWFTSYRIKATVSRGKVSVGAISGTRPMNIARESVFEVSQATIEQRCNTACGKSLLFFNPTDVPTKAIVGIGLSDMDYSSPLFGTTENLEWLRRPHFAGYDIRAVIAAHPGRINESNGNGVTSYIPARALESENDLGARILFSGEIDGGMVGFDVYTRDSESEHILYSVDIKSAEYDGIWCPVLVRSVEAGDASDGVGERPMTWTEAKFDVDSWATDAEACVECHAVGVEELQDRKVLAESLSERVEVRVYRDPPRALSRNHPRVMFVLLNVVVLLFAGLCFAVHRVYVAKHRKVR